MKRLGFVCAVVLALLPLAARAEGVDFTAPDEYAVAAPELNPILPPVYRVWDRSLSGVHHSIVVSALPTTTDLSKTVGAMAFFASARHAVDVSQGDAGLLCGAPSRRLTYAYTNQLTIVHRYVIVGGRLLTATYSRPVGTAPDPAALVALETLCSGVHQPGGPKGWSIVTVAQNGSAWHPSPDSPSLLAQTVRATQVGRDIAVVPDDGQRAAVTSATTVTSDRREACGAMTIRRVTATLDGGRIGEFASGTVRGYDYVVSYVRPASAPADVGAMQTLTSFCTDTAPR